MCEICQEVCPQHVNLHEIFIRVKNAAAEEKNIPESYSAETQQVYLYGKAVPIQPAIAKRREQLGLEPSNDVNVAEIQKLMHATLVDVLLKNVQAEKTNSGEKYHGIIVVKI